MRGYGDETWRLALAGDVEGLNRAAELLHEGEPSYEGHRARAFALAVEGRVEDALGELDAGRAGDWPFPAAHAADIARIRFLAGDEERALEALRVAIHGAEHVDASLGELASAVAPGRRRRALRVVASGGTLVERGRNALRVLLA